MKNGSEKPCYRIYTNGYDWGDDYNRGEAIARAAEWRKHWPHHRIYVRKTREKHEK